MFGFLQGARYDSAFRRLYVSHCSSNRDWMGRRSLPFLSYEAIFVSSLATDLGLIGIADQDTPRCCRTSGRYSALRNGSSLEDRFAAMFCGAFTMLLARVKLDDDIEDASSVPARFAKWTLKRQMARADAFFREISPGFATELETLLAEHAELETQGQTAIADYCRPTGEAFGLVFRLFPVGIAAAKGESVDARLVDFFEMVGQRVGRALIAFDCAVDYEVDSKRGHFNPLGGVGEAARCLEFSQRELIELGWMIAEHCDTPAAKLISCRTLRHRIQTIPRRTNRVRNPSMTRSFASLAAPRRSRAGICDCDCGVCDCDCGGCDAPNCDCSAKDADCSSPNCCDCCLVCDPCPGSSSGRKTSSAHPALSTPPGSTDKPNEDGDDLVGQTAEVVVALMPFGTVRLCREASLEAEEHPAKSDRGPISVGSQVRVVRRDAFGLLVRPIEADADPEEGV